MFYLFMAITEIYYYEKRHINATREVCHKKKKKGDKSTFALHVSMSMKEFVMDNLRLYRTLYFIDDGKT